ncbi:MAG TPA: DUF1501 domain-containing protein [Dongiaceae bacterium]|nr:DUF1501 domain-containing protein [Dongiaceae bacterium]
MASRRSFLLGLGAIAFAGGGARLALAAAPVDQRFVVIILRGAMDGLSAIPPYADPDYRDLRGALAIAAPGQADGALDLDGAFGLHPRLATLKALYDQKQLIVAHAVATAYRERSHFDGQDLLENGTPVPHGTADGWLNRTLALLNGDDGLGLALGDQVPLMLRGKVAVTSWAPKKLPGADADFVSRVAQMYQASPILLAALESAMDADRMAAGALGPNPTPMTGGGYRRGAAKALAEAAGKFLADPDGPRIAVLEINGWDTHSGQGTANGRLAQALGELDAATAALRQSLGATWARTAVLTATEFGRTAAPNGTGGTDHGTASGAFLMGGAIEGGRVLTDWPGLDRSRLYQGRDLAPTMDLRALAKGVLADHLHLPPDALARVVFPNSGAVAPIADLIRAT